MEHSCAVGQIEESVGRAVQEHLPLDNSRSIQGRSCRAALQGHQGVISCWKNLELATTIAHHFTRYALNKKLPSFKHILVSSVMTAARFVFLETDLNQPCPVPLQAAFIVTLCMFIWKKNLTWEPQD